MDKVFYEIVSKGSSLGKEHTLITYTKNENSGVFMQKVEMTLGSLKMVEDFAANEGMTLLDKKAIYYTIEYCEYEESFTLYSWVWTSFAGFAKNFVGQAFDEELLTKQAELLGWEKA